MDYVTKGSTTTNGGQYFRDFKNFGRPIVPRDDYSFFTSNHINVAPDTLRAFKYQATHKHNPYWILISACYSAIKSQLLYLPIALRQEYQVRKK